MAGIAIADQIIQKQDKDGMLRRALERIIQLYTDKSHFVYELLQNAEDAGATKIRFEQRLNNFTVLHDGHPFTIENLQGLCDIGKSDKIDDYNQIGEFGVGFKSVFGICQTVRLYSHPGEKYLSDEYTPFAVEIRDFTHPEDIEDVSFDNEYTTMFVFPYSVGHTFSGFDSVDKLNTVLTERLQDLGVTTLLFMKNLKSIEYLIDLPVKKSSGTYLLDKKTINDHCSLVSALGKGDNKKVEDVSYLMFSRPVEGFQSGRTIDIAFSVKIDKRGKYSFEPTQFPYISVYFPTETESKLKFIVQGPYRTTPNRSSVPSLETDNISLAEQTAQLLVDSVLELRDCGQLDYSLLNILPLDDKVFNRWQLFKDMPYEIKKLMRNEQVMLCKDGSYTFAECCKIARNAELAELFSDTLLSSLFNDGMQYHWMPTFLTETNKQYDPLYRYLTRDLKVDVVRPENLKTAFNSNPAFLRNRSDEWLVQMYDIYSNVEGAFSPQKAGSNMRTAEIIKTSTGNFVAAYRKVTADEKSLFLNSGSYLPNVFLPSKNAEGIKDINYVDPKIYKKCKYFFKDVLNLQTPNAYEFFVRDFKERCRKGQALSSDEQHISDVRNLVQYYGVEDYHDEISNLIKSDLLLRCTKKNKTVLCNPSKERVLLPYTYDGLSIVQYYANIEVFPYVDSDYYHENGINNSMLILLGVDNQLATGMGVTCSDKYDGVSRQSKRWSTEGRFMRDLNLDKLEDVLDYISTHPKSADSMAKSSIIFNFLKNNEDRLYDSVYGLGPEDRTAYADIVTTLKQEGDQSRYYGMKWNGKWLYTSGGELVSQKEITKRELNEHLYGQYDPDSEIYEYLGFAKNDEELLEDAAEEYDELDMTTKKQYFEIELRRRYNISIEDLDNSFGEGAITNHTEHSAQSTEVYDFPSAKVRSWDTLKKHVAEVLCYANPVKYNYKVRSIRVSRPETEIRAYLKGMYKYYGSNRCACQMCHKPTKSMEKCQLTPDMGKELDALYLCMCPNCAAKYRMYRNTEQMGEFLGSIEALSDQQISSKDPVEVEIGEESIWFTQTHIAEIRELLAYEEAVNNFSEPKKGPRSKQEDDLTEDTESTNISELDIDSIMAALADELDDEEDDHEPEPEEEVNAGLDVYREYIGKTISHKTLGEGVVTDCDGKHITIIFDSGPKAGQPVKYSLETCLNNGLIKIL